MVKASKMTGRIESEIKEVDEKISRVGSMLDAQKTAREILLEVEKIQISEKESILRSVLGSPKRALSPRSPRKA